MHKPPKPTSAQTWLFARNFLKHPNMLGWFLPSSRFLVARVLRQVDWVRAKVIVEYGPGVGTLTWEILRRMRPDAILIALETNAAFVKCLQGSLTDHRLHIVHRSAEDVQSVLGQLGHSHADYVISGIPFKSVPEAIKEPIVRATHSVLNAKGTFLVYNFSRAAQPYLDRVFRTVREDFEPLNIMPARLFYCMR